MDFPICIFNEIGRMQQKKVAKGTRFENGEGTRQIVLPGNETSEAGTILNLERPSAYPSTSLTFRDKFCRVKGFWRNAVPLSIVPSLTTASSV